MNTLMKEVGLMVFCCLGVGVFMLTQGCERQAQETYVLVAVGYSCDKWNHDDETSFCCDIIGEDALREAIHPITIDDFKKEVMHRCLLHGNGKTTLDIEKIRKVFQKAEFRLGHAGDMMGKKALKIKLFGDEYFPVTVFLNTCADTMVSMIQRHKVDWCTENRARTENDIAKQQKRLKDALHEMSNCGKDSNLLAKWQKQKEEAQMCDRILNEYLKKLDKYMEDQTPLAKVVRYATGKGR